MFFVDLIQVNRVFHCSPHSLFVFVFYKLSLLIWSCLPEAGTGRTWNSSPTCSCLSSLSSAAKGNRYMPLELFSFTFTQNKKIKSSFLVKEINQCWINQLVVCNATLSIVVDLAWAVCVCVWVCVSVCECVCVPWFSRGISVDVLVRHILQKDKGFKKQTWTLRLTIEAL